MNVPTSLGRALVLAATSLAATGALAEIRLYEHAKFGGAHVTLRSSSADISGTGFNDKTSSIVVTSGRWEVCTESDFRGTCIVLTRGEYPQLQSNMNDRISSAREAGGSDDRRSSRGDGDGRGDRGWDGQRRDGDGRGDRAWDGPRRDGDGRGDRGWDGRRDAPSRVAPGRGEAGLELYADADFGGESVRIDRDTADLARANFNDRATSAVVTGGVWEICSDARFAGKCSVYRPGQYARLGGLSRQVSSVRRVQ
jgi:hypothetical protein